MGLTDLRDFDLCITDVLLVLRLPTDPGRGWNGYMEGRRAWGVNCVMSGQGMLIYKDGSATKFRAGDVSIIPINTSYRFYVPVGTGPCDNCVINFQLSGGQDLGIDMDKATFVRPTDFSRVSKYFEESNQHWEHKEPGYKLLVMSKLYQIIYDILTTRMQCQRDPFAYRQTLPAQQYMANHYQENITLEQLAQMCDLSVTHFRRLFKSVYNLSPIAYLLNLRLEKSKDLLLANNYTLDSIADMTGFQNSNYYIRFFKQHVGMTPQQYRKMY